MFLHRGSHGVGPFGLSIRPELLEVLNDVFLDFIEVVYYLGELDILVPELFEEMANGVGSYLMVCVLELFLSVILLVL